MGNSRSLRRGLQKRNVYLAEKTGRIKHELAMQMVAERVKTDAEFAKDVLKVTGGIIRPDIKKDAEATISASMTETLGEKLDKMPPEDKQKVLDSIAMEGAVSCAYEGIDISPKDLAIKSNDGDVIATKSDIMDAIHNHRVESTRQIDQLLVGGDKNHEMVPEQTDGGGIRLVHPTSLPDYPRDGEILYGA